MGRRLVVYLLLLTLIVSGCATSRPAPDLTTERGIAEAVACPDAAQPPPRADQPANGWWSKHPVVKSTAISLGVVAGVVLVAAAVGAVAIAAGAGHGVASSAWH
jgi:hypothetical protein